MSDLYKDVVTGLIFIIGLLGFLSGEFILSSTLFAVSAIVSNVSAIDHQSKAKIGSIL